MATRKKEEVVAVETGEIVTADLISAADGVDFVPKSFEDFEAFFEDKGGLLTFEGSAYKVIDKKFLVDQPFVIVDVRSYQSKQYGNDVFAIMLLTKNKINDENHFVINDGSTGIYEQVKGMVERTHRKTGILCPNGLRASTYKVEVTDAFEGTTKEIEATTYYVQ